ncbi:hypothetical protein IQ272_23390 [Chroococcidiopsidales cyanobacterium LEGE 13417]|nr:hypothetical protein [Chroococcidiopsidales cyanobacterium LEGE 13417]
MQSDAHITEQARTSQLDALILQLESLPTYPEPHELSQIQVAIASLNDRLDNLTQQLNTQSEPQLEQRLLVQVGEIQRQLENLYATTAEQHNRIQQLKNDLELQIDRLRQETSELNDRIQVLDETPRRLEKVEQLTDELDKRTIVLDKHALSLVQVEQRIEMLQQLIVRIDLGYLQQQLANESAKSADLATGLMELSKGSATKQELDALTQLVVEETERLKDALAGLPTLIPQFDSSLTCTPNYLQLF